MDQRRPAHDPADSVKLPSSSGPIRERSASVVAAFRASQRPLLAAAVAAGLALIVADWRLPATANEIGSPRARARTAPDAAPRHDIPDKFVAVDTSRVLGSPDPWPLEAQRVFPALNFVRAVELTHAGDASGRIFVVEQAGRIHVFPNDNDVRQTKVFLDIREFVLRDGNEEGLLGLAFHPRYRENGELFVYYSTRLDDDPQSRASVVSRFKVSEDSDRVDRESEERLLIVDQPYFNHNGGSLRFGPDGFLYIGLGDGGAAHDPHFHGQDLSTLLGSILRIDIDNRDEGLKYAVPPDNPFVGKRLADGRLARGEIWAYGLRNNWRIAFDRQTGDLYTADVGQDRFEEVNLVLRGGNYGWNEREGFHDFARIGGDKPVDLIEPLVEYGRHDGQSVTGGHVYRGKELTDFDGAYFFGDYLSGNVWILRLDEVSTADASEGEDRPDGVRATSRTAGEEDGDHAPAAPGGAHGRRLHLRSTVQRNLHDRLLEHRQVAATGLEIAAFGEDQDGEIYLCGADGIYQLRPRDVNLKEVAKAFPRKLSETGLFASVPNNIPAEGVIPYEINFPFWSDYSVKDRYIALPRNGQVTFHAQNKWEFPVGTVFIKTFWLHRDRVELKDQFRLETRLLVRAPEGWAGYTYLYDEDQQDAYLLDGSLPRTFEVRTDNGQASHPYYFPARNECFACHTRQEGFVLGLNTRQMNRTLDYHGRQEDQIGMLSRLGVFHNPPDGDSEDLERFPAWGFGNFDRTARDTHLAPDRPDAVNTLKMPEEDFPDLARAWLEVNCAVCHRPDGIAPRRRDLRYHTPLDKMNVVGQLPQHGRMTPPGGEVLKPGEPYLSELLLRAGHRGQRQMPPLASRSVEERGIHVLTRWIEELSGTTAGDVP